jgi:signal transduction histidine kinase
MNPDHERMPKSVRKLWLRLTATWSIAWSLGLLLFALVAIQLASLYYDQQVDSRLRIQAIAVYGLAYFDDDGTFESDLLSYETELFEEGAAVWFVEPGTPPVFHLGSGDRRLANSELVEIANLVVKEKADVLKTMNGVAGQRLRLLAIPTYQGTSEVPKAAIIVAVDPQSATRAKWAFVLASLGAATLLGLLGIGVGGFLAKSSLSPLSEMMKRREQFLSAAAHELRTPLASIQAVVESAGAGNEPAEVALDRIGPLVKKATSNVDDLLLHARLNADRIQLNPSLTRLDLLVEACIPEDAHVELHAEETTINCDSQLVTVAIRNLLSNAQRHAGSSGRVFVRVAGPQVIVENEGDPFPHAVLESSQQQMAVSPSSTGNGLGLPTVQMIAQLHDGRLELENSQGTARAIFLFGKKSD